jgi:hypothetical protein
MSQLVNTPTTTATARRPLERIVAAAVLMNGA